MNRQLKVGLFVIFGLALTMLAIFLIGNTRRLWAPKVTYHAAFNDIAGLKPGAPVRMGGLDIGSVISLGHDGNAGDPRIYVRLDIERDEASRVRSDSVARIVNRGLLGDKMVELTVGTPGSPQPAADQLLKSEEPADMLAAANRIASTTQETIQKIQPLADSLGDPKFAADIKGSAADIHELLDAFVHGDGVAHRLVYDKRTAEHFDSLLAHLDTSTANLDATLADIRDVTDHVREGPGIAHALVYDGDMSKNAAGSLEEVHADLKAIREGNGLAHAVLYGDDPSQHVMANLNAMSDDLRVIVGNVRQGKGTIGALLVDPTVYEDIKAAVGNVERNEVLRALVRYSIKADEKHPAPQVQGDQK